MPEATTLTPRRLLGLAALAVLLHGLFDLLASQLPQTTPSYLRLQDGPEIFRMLSPVAVSVAASCVSGAIAGIALLAVEPRAGGLARGLILFVTGFWLVSALLFQLVWLSSSWGSALLGLAAGLPRGAVVGYCLARLSGLEVAPEAATGRRA